MDNTLKNYTFEDFQNYLLFDKKVTDKPSTLAPRKYRFNRIRRYFVDRSLTTENVKNFLIEEKSKGLKNSVLNRFIAEIKSIAKDLKLSAEFQEIAYFKENRRLKKDPLTWEEMNKIANVTITYKSGRFESQGFSDALNFRASCLIRFLAQTGCRIGEALKLLWTDIDGNIVTFEDTKNGKNREVVISPQLTKEINELPRKSFKIFNRTYVSQFNRDLKRRAEAAGIKKPVHAHLFRHSVITNLAKSGAPLAVLRDLVGHESLDTTSKYCHTKTDEIAQMLGVYSGAWEKNLSRSLVDRQLKNHLQTIMGDMYEKVRHEEDDKYVMIKIPKVLFDS